MAWKTVDKYYLGYNLGTKQYYFYYRFVSETTVQQIFPSAQEFMALADMFRNEGPISFNTTGNYFVTAPEAVGEGEPGP
jgi:hypothetical protein